MLHCFWAICLNPVFSHRPHYFSAQCMASQIIAKTLVYFFVFIGNILYTVSALRFLQLAIYLGELSKSVYRKWFLILSTDAYYSIEWCAVNDLTSSLLGVSSLLQLPPIWLWISLYVYHFGFLQVYLMGKFPKVEFRVKGKVPKFGRYLQVTLHRDPINLNSYQQCLRVHVLPTQCNLTLQFLPIWCTRKTVSQCATNF